MSESIDDDRLESPRNGEEISDDHVRAMLAKHEKETTALRQQLEQERASRTRAEAQVSNANASRFDTEEAAVADRLEAAEAQALGMRQALSAAMAEGRFDDAAELQDKLGEIRAKQTSDKQYKAWLAQEKTRTAQPVQQQPASDGVDLAAYSPAQRKWIRANPEFMTDASLRAKTFAGHQLAVAEGITIDSPEYFEVIDQTVGKKRAEPDDDEPPAPRPRAQSTDMPVTRRTPATPSRQQAIKLTADEMEAADITNSDIPVQGYKDNQGNWIPGRYERYAIQRAKLKAQGRG